MENRFIPNGLHQKRSEPVEWILKKITNTALKMNTTDSGRSEMMELSLAAVSCVDCAQENLRCICNDVMFRIPSLKCCRDCRPGSLRDGISWGRNLFSLPNIASPACNNTIEFLACRDSTTYAQILLCKSCVSGCSSLLSPQI